MTDHDHLSNTPDPSTEARIDARIDALARDAGSQLRRPAPADGIAQVQRAKRRRQTAQLGGAGVAAVAILAVGAFAIGGRDAGPTVVPATVSTVDTPDTTPQTTGGPESTVPDTEPSPPTSDPPDTPGSVPPNAAGSPTVLYTAPTFDASFGTQVSTVDPATGLATGTVTVDDAVSRASMEAQDALLGKNALVGRDLDPNADRWYFTTEYDIGDITYSIDSLPSEYQTYELFPAEALERFDRCRQSRLTVAGADASALPERVSQAVFSPDGRWLVTVSAVCPEAGTLVDGTSASDPVVVTRFDATRPDVAGVQLMDGLPVFSIDRISFSADSSFIAVSTFGDVAELSFFEAATGDRLDPLGNLDDDCSATGTRRARFIGPWIGESSIAVQLDCTESNHLVVVDLATMDMMAVALPVDQLSISFMAEVDYAHYDRPGNVWFTLCDGLSAQCWIGQGAETPLMPLPGAGQASFLPLGFEYGG